MGVKPEVKSRPMHLAFALVLAALPITATSATTPPILPADAIQLAAAAAPDRGVDGTFLLTVKATGEDKKQHRIFLNSELDYRDQRNLTVVIEPSALPDLEARYGKNPKGFLMGKQLLVTGTAKRVTIYFGRPKFSAVNGKLLNKYYFQAHLAVARGDQIVLTSPDRL
jgi:hypothetical protein